MPKEKAIEISDLKKNYSGGVEALKGIDLTIEQGDIFGLLGPNGAGKSTTISIVCSLLHPTSGTVKILGNDVIKNPSEAKKHIGVVPQEFNFNIFEPCAQIVMNQAGYYGVARDISRKRTAELFEQLGLSDKAKVPSIKLSGGMKRRLMIARALVHNPDILILDEPTAGVDISLRRSMWTFLEEQNKKGLTIILTTHYLEEAESLCGKIAIIDKGEIIEQGKTQDLLAKLSKETVILYTQSIPKEFSNNKFRIVEENTLEVELHKDDTVLSVVKDLEGQGIIVNRMKNKSNRLEELFLDVVEGH
ncbi:ABC transporter [Candidatus Marinamargulisbacteria bacterium SCGC AAA071-K20]|nr:ABC transporter [Candidatus Marinamargulisbacteria bacterium SCGC AAA071-K20]